jgi:SSS family solute:Na+ symporter
MLSGTAGNRLMPQAAGNEKIFRPVIDYLAPVVLLLMPLLMAGQDQTPVLVSYYGKTPVLDGVLSPGEWNDAAEFRGVKDWWPAFHPVADEKDLSMKGYVKHDDKFIYFAADVTDDLLYGIDTDRYLPASNPKAHELTREGFPWLGDEMEILLHTTNTPPPAEVEGNGSSWQMVCNLTKSRLGGVGVGGILEGEPRARREAWETYQKWIEIGAQKCAAKKKPEGKGYILEWAIRFDPCLEVAAGQFYSPDIGKSEMRVKIVLGDMDRKEDGSGNPYNFRHEQWYAPAGVPGERRAWGYLQVMGRERKP